MLIERLLAAFPNARFADAYGLTETVSGDTFNDQAHTLSKIGSVGKPVVNLDVQVLGPDEAPAGPGAQGEILLRGPQGRVRLLEERGSHRGRVHPGRLGSAPGTSGTSTRTATSTSTTARRT